VRADDVVQEITVDGTVDGVLATSRAPRVHPRSSRSARTAQLTSNSLGTPFARSYSRTREHARFLLASTSETRRPEMHPQTEELTTQTSIHRTAAVFVRRAKGSAEDADVGPPPTGGSRHVRPASCGIFNTYGPRLRTSEGRVCENFLRPATKAKPLTV